MRILIVLDHPYGVASADDVPHRRSFSAAVAAAAARGARAAGHEVDVIDLATDGFSPAMGFLDRVLTKSVLWDEVEGARGNPFRNRMTRLQGVTVLSVMTTPGIASPASGRRRATSWPPTRRPEYARPLRQPRNSRAATTRFATPLSIDGPATGKKNGE